MSKNKTLLLLLFIILISFFSFFSSELYLVFLMTFLFGYWVFFLFYSIYYIFLIFFKKVKINKKNIILSFITLIFSYSFFVFIVEEKKEINKDIESKIYKGDFCNMKEGRKNLTINSNGLPRNYILEKKYKCIQISSPSYSYIKIEYKYCGC